MPEEKMSPSSPQLEIVEHQGVAVALSAKEVASIYKKSRQSGIPFDTLEEVYRRGYSSWTPELNETPTQTAFNRINSFIANGFAANLDEDLRQWFDPKHPKGGWKRYNSKGEAMGPCAREPGEPKPKCMSNEKAASLSKKERAAAVARKRKKDPNPERQGKPINVSNYGKKKMDEAVNAAQQAAIAIAMKKEGKKPKTMEEEFQKLEEKNVPTSPEKWSRAKAMARSKFKVYPSAYANGWAAKKYKEMGGGWKSISEESDIDPNLPGKIDGSSYPTNAPVGTKFGSFIDKNGRKINKYVDQDLTTRFKPADEGDWKPESFPTNAPVGTKYGSFTDKDGKKYNKVVGADLVPNFVPTNEESDPCWTGYKKVGMKKKNGRNVPNCVPANEENIDEGIRGLKRNLSAYKDVHSRKSMPTDTPKSYRPKHVPSKKEVRDELNDLVAKYLAKGGKITKEEYTGAEKVSKNTDEPASRFVGTTQYTKTLKGDTPGYSENKSKLKTIKRIVKEACSCEDAEAKPESVKAAMAKMNKLKTPEEKIEFLDKYTKSALKKGGFTDGRFEKLTKKEVEIEEDAKGHKSPSGGLTQKGRDYYNRTTGSNLKAPVTTKPSKLKKGSKAANRRKSFCARMGGMKKRLTSAKTARDPNSRINKALRKWNC